MFQLMCDKFDGAINKYFTLKNFIIADLVIYAINIYLGFVINSTPYHG